MQQATKGTWWVNILTVKDLASGEGHACDIHLRILLDNEQVSKEVEAAYLKATKEKDRGLSEIKRILLEQLDRNGLGTSDPHTNLVKSLTLS